MQYQIPYLDPILIASPVRRSGTTLLQRLLCSAPNTLIYGENCVNELEIFNNFYFSKLLSFQYGQEGRDRLLQKVLDGDANDWITDLMPEMKGYLQALEESCFSIFKYYQQFAQSKGRPVWGMKMAEWHPSSIQQMQSILPKSRFVYIHRPLVDCVKSAKRVNMVHSGPEVQQFCQTYRQFLNIVQNQYPHPKLIIDYTQLLENPQEVIAQLEDFTGAKGIQASVLEQRINTLKSDVQRDPSGKGHLQPLELTEAELAIVKQWEIQ